MNTTLRCLLLDDELPGLKYLRLLCEGIPHVEVVKAFNDPLKFLAESQNLDFDVCIIDIEMPVMNGLELARLMHRKPVIFTTAYKEFAAEAFDLEAVDYIRKPIEKVRLEKALQKAALRVHESTVQAKHFQVNTNKGKALLYFDAILYITTTDYDSRDKTVLLSDGTEIIVKNMGFDKFLSLLPATEFCRVNKKDIIALRIIRFFSHEEIQTTLSREGKALSLALGDNYREDFLEKVKARQMDGELPQS